MENIRHFSIPLKGLKDGNHSFQFEVDDHFFRFFENQEIHEGNFMVFLEFDKKPGVSVMEFVLEGHARMNCDRCLEPINLPIHGEFRLLLKFGDEEESNDEVMYVDAEISILPLGQLIYEFIILSIPLVRTYNCQDEDPRPCNLDALQKLESNTELPTEVSSIWDGLKDINFDSN